MTLESSTTRQVFMVASTLPVPLDRFHDRCRQPAMPPAFRRDFQHAIDVEHDHQLSFEPMNAARHSRQRGSRLTGFASRLSIGKLDHFADRVDQQAVGFAAHDRCRPPSAAGRRRFGKPSRARMSIAVTMRPRRLRTPAISLRGQRHAGQPIGHEHVLHARDRQAEQLAADHRGDVFGDRRSALSISDPSSCVLTPPG